MSPEFTLLSRLDEIMGDWYQTIVDRDATEEEAPALAASVLDWLISEEIVGSDMTANVLSSHLGYPPGPNQIEAVDEPVPEIWCNGLDIITRRTVFHASGVEPYLICAGCGERFEPPDEWHDAIDEWYHGRGPGILRCIRCNHTQPVTDWQHDPPWGFGYLGFKFWNWPLLRVSFIEDVSQRLGHRVILVEGKI